MTIYLDVLLGINLIVNYYLLLLTIKFNSIINKGWRIVLGAIVGSVFSIYIFIEVNSTLIDCIVKLICSVLMILVSVGYQNIKAFLRNIIVLFTVSFIYSGAMMGLWSVFKWDTIVINNSTVYLDISALYLITFSVIFYLVIVLAKSMLSKNSIKAQRCNVDLTFGERKTSLTGIFDTGNSVKDIFSDSSVIFISHSKALNFLGGDPKLFKNAYRLLPCRTVTGSKLLEAVRIDKAEVVFDQNCITLYKPILAISEISLDKEYSLILNPEILMSAEDNYVKIKN